MQKKAFDIHEISNLEGLGATYVFSFFDFLVVKIRFDTAENEPAKTLQNFFKN